MKIRVKHSIVISVNDDDKFSITKLPRGDVLISVTEPITIKVDPNNKFVDALVISSSESEGLPKPCFCDLDGECLKHTMK
jgi:hypothetical protein